MDFDNHVQEIYRLKKEADRLLEDTPAALMQKIELLAKCLVYIGRVSSVLDGDYKKIYAKRKYEQALAHTKATKDKAAMAEIAVKELRELEAEAYENMNRWRNAMASTTEEINALKLRMRIDFHIDGGSYVQQSKPRS